MQSTDVSAYPQLLKQPVCTYSAADIERDGDQHCQVVGCARSMGQEKHYYRKFGVCEEHMKSPHIVVEGLLSRFCQQCGRFHSIESFDGTKRSCREMLLRHSTRRNSNKRPLSSSMRGPGLESSLATGDLSSTVNDVSSSAISNGGQNSHGQVEQGFSLRPKSLAATPAKSMSPAPSFSPSNHPSTSPNSTQSQLNMHLQPQPAHSSTAPLHDNFADFMAGRNPQLNHTTRHHAIPHSDSQASMDRISPQDMVHEFLASFLDGQEQPALAPVSQNIENPSCKSTPCSKRMRRFSENTSLSSLVPSTGWMMNLGEDQVSSQPGQPSNSNNSGPDFPANICDVLNKLSVADRERVRQWLAEHTNDQTSQEQQSHHRMHAAALLDGRMPRLSTQGPQMPGHVHDKNCGCRGTPFDLVPSRCTDAGCHHGPFASCNTTNHRHGAHGCCDHTQGMNGAAPYAQQGMYHGAPSQHVKQECHPHSFSCSHAPKPGTAANAEMLPNLSAAAQQAWALAQSMYSGAPMPSGVSPQMLLERMARFMMPGARSDDTQNEFGHANCQGHHCGHHHHTNAPETDNMLMHGLSTMNMHSNNMQQFVNSTAAASHPAYRMPASNGGEGKRYNHGPHGSCSSCSSCTASRSATPQPAVAPGWDTDSNGPPDAPAPPAALSWMLHAADAEALAMFRPSLNREAKEGTQGSAQPWSSMDVPANPTSNNPFLPNHAMSHAHGNTDDWNMPGMGGSRQVLSTRALQETQNFSMQRFLNNCLDGRVDGASAMTQGMESFMDNEGYDPSSALAGLNPALLSRPEFLLSVAQAAGGMASTMAPR